MSNDYNDDDFPSLSFWNHRVVKRVYNLGDMEMEDYGIHEVTYDEAGQPALVTSDPIEIHAESIDGLRETLRRCNKALNQPVLSFDDFDIKVNELDINNNET